MFGHKDGYKYCAGSAPSFWTLKSGTLMNEVCKQYEKVFNAPVAEGWPMHQSTGSCEDDHSVSTWGRGGPSAGPTGRGVFFSTSQDLRREREREREMTLRTGIYYITRMTQSPKGMVEIPSKRHVGGASAIYSETRVNPSPPDRSVCAWENGSNTTALGFCFANEMLFASFPQIIKELRCTEVD